MYILAFRQGMTYLKDVFGSLSGLYEDSIFVGDTFEFLDLRRTSRQKNPQRKPSLSTIKYHWKMFHSNIRVAAKM